MGGTSGGAGCLLGHVCWSGWRNGQGNGLRSVSIKCLAKALLFQPGASHLSPQTGLPGLKFLLASDCYWGHDDDWPTQASSSYLPFYKEGAAGGRWEPRNTRYL